MAKAKYSIKKYNGDDSVSYAIFRARDVRGKGSVITYEDYVTPFRGYAGLTNGEAKAIKERLEKEC